MTLFSQIKCHQYWPLGHDGNKELLMPSVNLKVEHVSETQMDYYTTRILKYAHFDNVWILIIQSVLNAFI